MYDKNVGKTLPGTYMNFTSSRNDVVNNNSRGVVVMPLINYNYGPTKEFFNIYSSAPDGAFAKLGLSVYDDDNEYMLLIREAFKNASQVIIYVIGPTDKATATVGSLTVTAKYAGSLGNNFKVVIETNASSGYDVSIYLNDELVVLQEGVSTISELEENNYVDFSGDGDLTANAGTNLTGGAETDATNHEITTFLDDIENVTFNVLCYPITDSTLLTALKTKIKYLREDVERGVQAVAPDFDADYEGIINVTNSVVVDDVELTNAQACAWVAGVSAAASELVSNTEVAYDGATDVVNPKTYEDAVAAVKNGEFFFAKNTSGDVVVKYDINSLVTYGTTSSGKNKSYRKNRVIRVFDAVKESIHLNFPVNKYDNDSDGWSIMEGVGKTILKNFEDEGAIKDVDYDNDFLVDQSLSIDDETYFNVFIQPVDSAEKLFFDVKTS